MRSGNRYSRLVDCFQENFGFVENKKKKPQKMN